MIFQAYHESSQLGGIFPYETYQGFDLLSLGLDHWEQKQLSEYGAIRYLFLHPEKNADKWIGFTSANQHTETRFLSKDAVASLLVDCDAIVWGWHGFTDDAGNPVSLAAAGERTHPGLNSILYDLLRIGGLKDGFPQRYLTESEGPYHNYWAMSKSLFNEYMEWSLPLVELCLTLKDDPFISRWPRATSYIHERLWICWAAWRELKLTIMNKTRIGNVDLARRIEKQRIETSGKIWRD